MPHFIGPTRGWNDPDFLMTGGQVTLYLSIGNDYYVRAVHLL